MKQYKLVIANILGQIKTNALQMRLKPFNSAVFVNSKMGSWKIR